MKNKVQIFASLLAILLISGSLFSQSRNDLKKERARLNQQISTTQKLLDKTGGTKKQTLASLETLQAQMSSRRQLVENYKKDLKLSEERLIQLDDSISTLESDLRQKTEEYISTLRKMYRWKKMQPSWMYYISAAGANQLFRRWIYLNQIETWQNERRKQLLSMKEELEKRRASVKAERDRRERQMRREQANDKALSADIQSEKKILSELKKQENALRRKLKNQIADKNALDNAIASAIKKGRETTSEKKASSFAKTPEGKAISGAFASNKGRLPWPVDRGVVTRKFGKQAHPTLSNIQIQNNGIDISTEARASVKSIFEGKVVGTAAVPGYHNMIIIRHGKYFTVYSRLQEIFVAQGEDVILGQVIGTLAVDNDESQSRLHFEIWEDKKKINPISWIAKSR